MKKLVVGVIGIILITHFGMNISADSVDLVEMKKKEEERRKNLKKSKYKLNNTNINKVDVPKKKYSFMQVKPDSQPKKNIKRDNSKKTAPLKAKSDPIKTQKYWQDLKNQLQNEIISLNEKINNDQLKLNQLNTNLTSMSIPSGRASLKNEIDNLSTNLGQDKKKLKSLQDELEAFFEKARKAGIPPGWIR